MDEQVRLHRLRLTTEQWRMFNLCTASGWLGEAMEHGHCVMMECSRYSCVQWIQQCLCEVLRIRTLTCLLTDEQKNERVAALAAVIFYLQEVVFYD